MSDLHSTNLLSLTPKRWGCLVKSVLPGQQCSDIFLEIANFPLSISRLCLSHLLLIYPSFVLNLSQTRSLYVVWCFRSDVMNYSNFYLAANLCSERCVVCG